MTVLAINAFYRTGSSFLYDVFNQSSEFTGFYEPLHPDIANQNFLSDTDQKNNLGHTFAGSYFDVYKQVSEQCIAYNQLVRESTKPFQYPILKSDERNYGLKKYLSLLELEHQQTIPVLQFNRSLFCIPWIKKNFPHWKILHLSRNYRNVFCSLRKIANNEKIILLAKPAPDFWGVKSHLQHLLRTCGVTVDHTINNLNFYQHLYLLLYLSDIIGKLFSDYCMTYENILRGRNNVLERVLVDTKIKKQAINQLMAYASEKFITPTKLNPWENFDYNFYADEVNALKVLGKININKIVDYFSVTDNGYKPNNTLSALNNRKKRFALNINETTVSRPRIAHLINPYLIANSVDKTQLKSISSFKTAIDLSNNTCDVELISFIHQADFLAIPTISSHHIVLTQRIGDFVQSKKPYLPLLGEIVNQSRKYCKDHDYLVITNMDICLQPYFYLEINRIIAQGFDAFVINRRTLPENDSDHPSLLTAYQDFGESHPGHDCFVFKRELLDHFYLLNHCLGAGFCFRPLLLNLIIFAEKFHEFTDSRLTFHYGNDETWRDNEHEMLIDFNREELIECYHTLEKRFPEKFKSKQALIKQFFNFGFLNKK